MRTACCLTCLQWHCILGPCVSANKVGTETKFAMQATCQALDLLLGPLGEYRILEKRGTHVEEVLSTSVQSLALLNYVVILNRLVILNHLSVALK